MEIPNNFVSLDYLLAMCDLAQKHELAGNQPDFMNPNDFTHMRKVLLYSCIVKAFNEHNTGRYGYRYYLRRLGVYLDNYRGKSVNDVLSIMYTADTEDIEYTFIDCVTISNLIKYYVEIPAATFVHFFQTDFNLYVADALTNSQYYVYVVSTHNGVIYSHDTKFNLVSLVLATNANHLICRLLEPYIQNAAEQPDFSGRIPIEYISPKDNCRLLRKVLTPQWSHQYNRFYDKHRVIVNTVMTINHIPYNVLHLLPRELVYIILRFTLV